MSESRIFLVGFMGSGKSTIGSILAQALGYSFLDLDEEIVRVTEMSITEIFETRGEDVFRDIERHALDATIQLSNTVISLGGGAAVTNAASNLILTHGTVIYLELPSEELTKRLSGSTDRPLLMVQDDISSYVSDKLDERRVFYESAHLTIDCLDKTEQDVVDEIQHQL